ncbi:MAG: hypothetical protein JWM85_1504 [Acidimicrobiaceae bacterium]|nr:hypothetical protein [Acidimicrobiaceae bacterium]
MNASPTSGAPISAEVVGLLEDAGPVDPYGRLVAPPEVLVAIALAVEECWPRAGSGEIRAHTTPAWRFSARWWSGPVALRRDRP